MANYKPVILISSLIVAALGGYYIYKTKFKKIEVEEPAEEPVTEPVKATVPAPKTKPKVTAPKADPPRVTTGFATPPTGPQSVAVKAPKMGANLYVLSPKGANAYKTAQASQTNIYKYYPKGAFIGTFLSKAGSMSKVIVEQTTLGIRTNKEVFVPSTEIYEKNYTK